MSNPNAVVPEGGAVLYRCWHDMSCDWEAFLSKLDNPEGCTCPRCGKIGLVLAWSCSFKDLVVKLQSSEAAEPTEE